MTIHRIALAGAARYTYNWGLNQKKMAYENGEKTPKAIELHRWEAILGATMWGYYGSKSKIINKYPPPKFSKIIEPFAGTAQYSLLYWDRDVLLIEKYDVIANIWKWLQKCSRNDILSIRMLKCGENTDDFKWDCQEQKDLIGFIITGAPSVPKKTASKWKTIIRPNTQKYKLQLIADSLEKIKHWEIIEGDYTLAKNENASWFIDPPYIIEGKYYKHNNKNINYNNLSVWCKERLGQAIVCEADGASWLPFSKICESRGNLRIHKEAIWTN